jgi:hypothetical protein
MCSAIGLRRCDFTASGLEQDVVERQAFLNCFGDHGGSFHNNKQQRQAFVYPQFARRQPKAVESYTKSATPEFL